MYGIWPDWPSHCSDPSTLTVPVGEMTYNEAGSVVMWDSSAAEALFEALRSDGPIPQQVFDTQP